MINYILYYLQSDEVGDGAETDIIGTSHDVARLKSHIDVEMANDSDRRVEWNEPIPIAEEHGGGFRYEGYLYFNDSDEDSVGTYIIEPVKEI